MLHADRQAVHCPLPKLSCCRQKKVKSVKELPGRTAGEADDAAEGLQLLRLSHAADEMSDVSDAFGQSSAANATAPERSVEGDLDTGKAAAGHASSSSKVMAGDRCVSPARHALAFQKHLKQ